MKRYQKMIYPYLIWGTFFIVLPMILLLFYAFTTSGNEVLSFHFTLEHFRRFFDKVFLRVLLDSLKIASITTLISIFLAYPLAYVINKQSEKVQILLILLITIPMWINMLVRTYAWISILSDVGFINRLLQFLGFEPVQFLYRDSAVIVGMVYNFLPFMIIQIYTALNKMDQSLIEASYDLGANRVETFWKVVFPLSLPGLISGIILVFLPSLSSFVIPQFLGGGQYVLIGNLIENQFINLGDYHFGSAISLIMAALMMVLLQLSQRFEEKYGVN